MDLTTMKADIAEAIARISTQAARAQMQAELDILVGRYDAAGASPEQRAEVEARLVQLRRDAEIAGRVSLWSVFSQALVLLVIGVYFFGIWLYLYGLGAPIYAGVDATRSVLVFTLSVAMLGFGGLLMVRTLYATGTPDELREQFRNAREVFLVFSGVFGSLIGFYFGTASSGSAADPPTVAAPIIGQDGTVVATISNGRAPFTGRIRLQAGDDRALAPSDIPNQLSVRLDKARDCPASVTVTDRDGRQATANVQQSQDQLLHLGWATCVPPNNGSNNSASNASANNVQADGSVH